MKKLIPILVLTFSCCAYANIEDVKESCKVFTKDTDVRTIISQLERNCNPNNSLECTKLDCFKSSINGINFSQQENSRSQLADKKLKYQVDDVAQVLNYSTGYPDEGGRDITWVSTNEKCVYSRINKNNGQVFNTVDLNKLDPKSIRVVTMNRTNTSSTTIYRYQTQEVQYMGDSLFVGENLDQNRLQRGWNLIYSKYCSGTKKAF